MKSILALLPLAVYAISDDAQIPLASGAKPLTLDEIPLLGFGTWNLKGENVSDIVSFAIQTGYRHIDGAAAYGNEELVGAGIADGLLKTGLKREDLWITSKLWNDQYVYLQASWMEQMLTVLQPRHQRTRGGPR